MPGDLLICTKLFVNAVSAHGEHVVHVGDRAVIIGEEHVGSLSVRSVACITILHARSGCISQMTGWCTDHYWRSA